MKSLSCMMEHAAGIKVIRDGSKTSVGVSALHMHARIEAYTRNISDG